MRNFGNTTGTAFFTCLLLVVDLQSIYILFVSVHTYIVGDVGYLNSLLIEEIGVREDEGKERRLRIEMNKKKNDYFVNKDVHCSIYVLS